MYILLLLLNEYLTANRLTLSGVHVSADADVYWMSASSAECNLFKF